MELVGNWVNVFISIIMLIVPTNGSSWSACHKRCGKNTNEEMWHGRHLCAYAPGSAEPEPLSKCFIDCVGYQVADNQVGCFLKYCKTEYPDSPPHQEFCSEPGKDAFIGKDDCDNLVSTGNASYFGSYCQATDEDLQEATAKYGESQGAHRRHVKMCNSLCRNATGEDAWKGKGILRGVEGNLCGYYEEIPVIVSQCWQHCFNTLRNSTYNASKIYILDANCQCRYCKYDPMNYISFCAKPGWKAHIEKEECDSHVCTGKAHFHGAYCNPNSLEELEDAKSNYGDTPQRKFVKQCNAMCRNASGEDVWKGKGVFRGVEAKWCGYYEDIPVIVTQCWQNCYATNNQNLFHESGFRINTSDPNCECRYCKYDPMNYLSFCAKPGWRAHIKQEECDSLVCSGKANFHGSYCNPTSQTEFANAQKQFEDKPYDKMHKCWKKCGGDKTHYQDLWKGELVCAHKNKDCVDSQISWNTKCYWDCMEIKIAEDQNECACDSCKGSPLDHKNYCEDPGIKTFVDKDCDMHVCNGTVKYHGKFCNFKTRGELEQARLEYGILEIEFGKCLAKCGGRMELLKDLYRGQHVCVMKGEGDPETIFDELLWYNNHTFSSRCTANCMGYKIADNNNECACSVCKGGPPPELSTNRGFCEEKGQVISMTADDCTETVCSGKFKYFGELCNATKEQLEDSEKKYGETLQEKFKRCRESCPKEEWSRDALTGRLVCIEMASEDGSVEDGMVTKCFAKCLGYQPVKDQNKCACNICKGNLTSRDPLFDAFCLKPGPQASIDKEDCDRLVCTGEAKFHGTYCNVTLEELAAERKKHGLIKREKPARDCNQMCEQVEDYEKEMWNGQFVCGYEDPDYTKPFMNTRCYFDCRGLQIVEDQTQCQCDFCKDQLDNHEEFCVKPGWRAKISRDQCDEMVCTGQAKYYRSFCNPISRKEITDAQEKFGDSKSEPTKSCWKDCDEKEWYKEMFKGEHVCGYLKSGPVYIPVIEQKCVLDCLNITTAKSQKKCSFQYCYDSPRNSHSFCVSPGVNTAITKDDCYRMVQRGNATYHGDFCDLHTDAEFEEAKKLYGD